MNTRGCLGRKMYSDSTLKSFTKEELIDLLHLADYNYRNLEDTYERSVTNSQKLFSEYENKMKELSEKATPKKPTEADASEENSYCAWLCPTCGRTHINNYPLNYCSDCGQKIDWSDYEKYLDDSEDDEEAEEYES